MVTLVFLNLQAGAAFTPLSAEWISLCSLRKGLMGKRARRGWGTWRLNRVAIQKDRINRIPALQHAL
jgi:hypothetical protein